MVGLRCTGRGLQVAYLLGAAVAGLLALLLEVGGAPLPLPLAAEMVAEPATIPFYVFASCCTWLFGALAAIEIVTRRAAFRRGVRPFVSVAAASLVGAALIGSSLIDAGIIVALAIIPQLLLCRSRDCAAVVNGGVYHPRQ